ncbi:MAG: class I SAM-dependent methyltransferase [Candidatus Pacebacteria bacterium]|nr:class I SAM-dependent methyltransferase [Candidatus Paceibacterota bacterium]
MHNNLKNLPVGHLTCCQICRGINLQPVIEMGFFSPCDSLLTKAMLHQAEVTYPLNVVRCRDCGLVQLDYAVNPKELFYPEYPYRSGITETLRQNLHNLSTRMIEKTGLAKNSLVVDIGSNDGTILEGFKNNGMRVLGVEPTNIADMANANGIETIKEFFTLDVAKQVKDKYGPATLIAAANVFAHVGDIADLMGGIYELLGDDCLFISESHYQLSILERLQYDSIYHEHLRFYLIKPLMRLFQDSGLTLVDIERIPNYGGSIRVYARKGLNHNPSEEVLKLLKIEEEGGAYQDKTYEEFKMKAENSRRALRSFMVKLNDEGKSVVGIGCPARSATLLQYCGITPDLLPYIAEQSTSLKLGMFTANTHIPVIDEAKMFQEQPEYGLMLSWHYAEPIIKSLRARGLKSKIIVPLPEIKIFE